MAEQSSTLRLALSGYSEKSCPADVEVVSYDRSARLKRSLTGLGILWGAAALSVLIPVAHFFLVPGLFSAGIVIFFHRLRTDRRPVTGRGTCPHCGTEQELDLLARWQLPQNLTCCHCQRTLSLHDPGTRE